MLETGAILFGSAIVIKSVSTDVVGLIMFVVPVSGITGGMFEAWVVGSWCTINLRAATTRWSFELGVNTIRRCFELRETVSGSVIFRAVGVLVSP